MSNDLNGLVGVVTIEEFDPCNCPELLVSDEDRVIAENWVAELKLEQAEGIEMLREVLGDWNTDEELLEAYLEFRMGLFNPFAEQEQLDSDGAWKGAVETNLRAEHIADLRKSGLTFEMIAAMGCQSLTGSEIHKKIYGTDECKTPWYGATGYAIPYVDEAGKVLQVRYRIFGDPHDKGSEALPKYLSVQGAKTRLYVPPGARELISKSSYFIVTEGEKKAAKAVQEGFPCVALAGIHMWANSVDRQTEKSEGTKLNYASKMLPELLEVAHLSSTDQEKKSSRVLIVFDSDARTKPQVRSAAYLLKDACLFQATNWCRVMDLPVPADLEEKWGIDDLLVSPHAGLFKTEVENHLKLPSNFLSPLFELPYLKEGGKTYSFVVKTRGPFSSYDKTGVWKQEPGDGDQPTTWKLVSETALWLSAEIKSVDGDDTTLYELTYVPNSEYLPRKLIGGAEVFGMINTKEDLLAERGAKIHTKHKADVEDFLIQCQKYGVMNGQVQKLYGTKKRGWRDPDEWFDDPMFVTANRVITGNINKTSSAASTGKALLPVPASGTSDEKLKQALVTTGDRVAWVQAINDHVLQSTLPTLLMGAGIAGIFRHWCSSSENFIFHLYGDSSAGKTNAMRAAASMWGNPKMLIDTWKATTNGLERKAVGRSDMVLFLDEAGMAEETELAAAIYAIGNGDEKLRATKEAGERVTTKFKLVALSTGEKQLVRGKKFVGQEVRALELRVDIAGPLWRSIHSAEEAEQFAQILDENHGYAVDAVISAILDEVRGNPKSIHDRWEARTARLRALACESDDSIPKHVMRRLKHFGICLLGVEYLLRHVIEWSEFEIEDKLEELSEVIVAKMIQLDTDQFREGETKGILQHFVDQLAASQSNFMLEGKGGAFPRDMYGSIEGRMVYCVPTKLGEMIKPYDNARLIQAAESVGALMTRKAPGRKDRKTISHRLGATRPDCYVFDLEKIEEFLYENE